jgi:hypothetical protein
VLKSGEKEKTVRQKEFSKQKNPDNYRDREVK